MNIKLIQNKDILQENQEYSINNVQKKALLENPFANQNSYIQILATNQQEIMGSVITFPLEIWANQNIYAVSAGSTLTVNEKYRKNGIGSTLTTSRLNLSPEGIAIASGLSHMSLPIFKKLGFHIFKTNRLVFILKSRPIIEKITHGAIQKTISFIIDFFLLLHKSTLKLISNYNMRAISIQETNIVPNEIEQIIQEDKHRFREHHTKPWFIWIKNNSFSNDFRSKQHLYILKHKNETIGFYMTKVRFHKKASQKGFQNILLGSVIEWGLIPNNQISEKQLCLAAMLSFKENIDVAEICTDNTQLIRYLKQHLFVKAGESNFAINALKNSPLNAHTGYDMQNNWRLRPAASDNGIS